VRLANPFKTLARVAGAAILGTAAPARGAREQTLTLSLSDEGLDPNSIARPLTVYNSASGTFFERDWAAEIPDLCF
jgi:hypothetical protein